MQMKKCQLQLFAADDVLPLIFHKLSSFSLPVTFLFPFFSTLLFQPFSRSWVFWESLPQVFTHISLLLMRNAVWRILWTGMMLKDDKDSIVVADCLRTMPGLHCSPMVPHLLSTKDIVHSRAISGIPTSVYIKQAYAIFPTCSLVA